MIAGQLKQFIRCHEGTINRLLHIAGFGLLGVGVWQLNIWLVLLGGVVQEFGHIYQYAKTRDFKDSPFYCIKPQALFAYPVFILLIIYVLEAK